MSKWIIGGILGVFILILVVTAVSYDKEVEADCEDLIYDNDVLMGCLKYKRCLLECGYNKTGLILFSESILSDCDCERPKITVHTGSEVKVK